MSLDIYLTTVIETDVFEANITHNLNTMAGEAGIYACLWRPEEVGIQKASQLIDPLEKGLELMKANPSRFQAFDASNGWGKYKDFVPWLERLLAACKEFPDAKVRSSRCAASTARSVGPRMTPRLER